MEESSSNGSRQLPNFDPESDRSELPFDSFEMNEIFNKNTCVREFPNGVVNENFQGSSNCSERENDEIFEIIHEKLYQKIWKKRKLLCILTGILTILIIFVLILWLILSWSEEPNEESSSEIPPFHLEIVNRIEWGALPPSIELPPLELPSIKAIIGDTAGSFCSTQLTCSKLVRLIQETHMKEEVIDHDIGYNFLVGGDGRVYEGRGWFKEGAHTYNHNKKSIGIWFIGTFDEVTPPEEQLTACELLLEEGVRLGLLEDNYKLYAYRQLRPHLDSPGDKLYEIIRTWPHWSEKVPGE